MDYASNDQGWSDYYDARAGMGAIGGYQQMAGLSYAPNLNPVGSGASYWPGDVSDDTDALAFLGFLNGGVLQSYGSQSADMANDAGAWDANFKAAVTAFQTVAAPFGYTGTVDGWIGPKTRAALGNAVAAKNAAEPTAPPFTPPAVAPAPGVPAFVPPGVPGVTPPSLTPASASSGGSTTTKYLAIGAGVLILGGVAAWALLD